MSFWEKTKAFFKSKWQWCLLGLALIGAAIFGKKKLTPEPPARPDVRPQLHEAETHVRDVAAELRDAEVKQAEAEAHAAGAEKLRTVERQLEAETPAASDLDAINLRADSVSPRAR